MDNRSFDRFTRQAADGVSRRTTLMTLGAAGLAALIGPFAADAKKGKKKKKKNQNSTIAPAPLDCPPAPVDRCPAQVNSCKTIVGVACGGDPSCADTVECCSLLETCDASGFWACFVTTASN